MLLFYNEAELYTFTIYMYALYCIFSVIPYDPSKYGGMVVCFYSLCEALQKHHISLKNKCHSTLRFDFKTSLRLGHH